jgi:hypothetical protein
MEQMENTTMEETKNMTAAEPATAVRGNRKSRVGR